jgi:hypothetical protein
VNVEDMTPEQQIERLIEQRNALWRLIDKFAMEHGDERNGLRSGDGEYTVDESDDAVTVRFSGLERLKEVRLAAGALWDRCRDIVGNTYVVEGVNHRSGDRIDDSRENIYTRVAARTGTW